MRTLKRALRHPSRWRRGKGFGVHSPFAFNFITKVLGEKDAAYYAYADIEACCRKNRRGGFYGRFAGKDKSVHEALMIFRTLCHFNPVEVIEMGHGHEETDIILERAVPEAKRIVWHRGRITDAETESPFILINRLTPTEADEAYIFLKNLIDKTDAVIALRDIDVLPCMRQLWEKLCNSTDHGMGFSNDYTAIYVSRRFLPHQIFNIVL